MFKDLKIVELASVLAGPAVGMFFSELGATVIKVENKKTGGDMTRKWKLSGESSEASISAYYASVNYNKTSLLMDLSLERDRAIVLKHIQTADIVIANYKEGQAEKLGMDFQSLKKLNPNLIYGNIIGFETDDNRSAFDLVLQAETGFMSINGDPQGLPTKMPVALIDVLCAHQLKEGLLIALWKREKTGEGSYVEASLFRSAIASLVNQAGNWLMGNINPQRMGSLHPNIAPYGEIFNSKDNKQFVLAIGTENHFKLLCETLDLEEAVTSEKYLTNQLRVSNREELKNILQNKISKVHINELRTLFLEHSIPFGQIKTIQEVFDEPHAKKMILKSIEEEIQTVRVSSIGFSIS